MTDRLKLGYHIANDMQYTGYGQIGHAFRTLFSRDEEIELLAPDSFGWDLLVAISPPRAVLIGPHERPDVVIHTMFEAEPLPPRWVDAMNRVGLIWSPSLYCRDLFEESGVRTPIVVGGYGYDPTMFAPSDRREHDGKFRVLVWGDNMMSRKHLMKALQAYVWADLRDAELQIKVNDTTFFRDNVGVKDEDGEMRKDITIIPKPMLRHELVAWLHSGDVLIYLSGGEGFGLIPLEAMATALPCIMMINTGLCDYVTPDMVLEVPSKGRGPAPSLVANYGIPNLTIEHPNVDVAVEHLKWAYANRDQLYDLGELAQRRIQNLTWEKAGKHIADCLRLFASSNSVYHV